MSTGASGRGTRSAWGEARLLFRAEGVPTWRREPTGLRRPAGADPPGAGRPRRPVPADAATGTAFTQPASIRQLASELVVGEAAVKFHLANLYDKFDLRDTDLSTAGAAGQRGVPPAGGEPDRPPSVTRRRLVRSDFRPEEHEVVEGDGGAADSAVAVASPVLPGGQPVGVDDVGDAASVDEQPQPRRRRSAGAVQPQADRPARRGTATWSTTSVIQPIGPVASRCGRCRRRRGAPRRTPPAPPPAGRRCRTARSPIPAGPTPAR